MTGPCDFTVGMYALEEEPDELDEEEVDVDPDALALLTKIGTEAGLRYASNLLTTSQLVAAKRRANRVSVDDVQRSFRLFLDPARSVTFVAESERRLIGPDGAVDFSVNGSGAPAAAAPATAAAGGDAMEIS